MTNVRNQYDLSSKAMVTGHIGRLQTLQIYPVVADDSFELEASGIIRLSPLRREVVSEWQIDVHGFFVPHRHIYGSAWALMLKEGVDSPATGITPYSIAAASRNAPYLGVPALAATTPKWLIDGYNWIWDQYYRIPYQPSDATMGTFPTGAAGTADERWRKYGRLCARLDGPLTMTTRVNSGGAISWRDLDYATDTDVAAVATLDVADLARVQGELRSEIQATYFSDRYRDVLNSKFGTSVSIDADQRPELLFSETFMMSGHDVDGTDQATLGSFVGKANGSVRFYMPRKHFNEHGCIWVMALVRPEHINQAELHPLTKVAETYLNTVADPAQWENREPEPTAWSDWINTTTPTTGQTQYYTPFGSHYRIQPNRIHPDLDFSAGYPWSVINDPSGQLFLYHSDSEYGNCFTSVQFGHYQIALEIQADAWRRIPKPEASIFTGTK